VTTRLTDERLRELSAGNCFPPPKTIGEMARELLDLRAEIRDLREPYTEDEIQRLVSGMPAICVFCGTVYPAADDNERRARIVAHIATCEKHPVHAVCAENEALRALRDSVLAWHADGCPIPIGLHRRPCDCGNPFHPLSDLIAAERARIDAATLAGAAERARRQGGAE
jgi:hypothetical protein